MSAPRQERADAREVAEAVREVIREELRGSVRPDPARELGFLIAVLTAAGADLIKWGSDVDGKIIQAHAAQLARGCEWPGNTDPITSTFDFEGSDDPRLRFRQNGAERSAVGASTADESAAAPPVREGEQ